MPNTPLTDWQCAIFLTSQDDAPDHPVWQQECRTLYQRFAAIVRETQGSETQGKIEPLRQTVPTGAKTDVLEVFQQLMTYGLSIGAFAGIYNLAKLWLEQRQRCEIELVFPDNSKLKMRGLSWEEAERKIREHQTHMASASQTIIRP